MPQHYLEDFTELLPAPPDKEQTVAEYITRAEEADPEDFILLDRGRTKRAIDEKVKYATRTHLDTVVQDAMIADGFTEAEIRQITNANQDLDPSFMERIRAVNVKREVIECAEFHFDEKRRAHDKMLISQHSDAYAPNDPK